jgi:SH3-like domain-containing protein
MALRVKGVVFGAAVIGAVLLGGGERGRAADNEGALPVPRFVTLHADKVNLRTGPGDRYPIEWVLTRKDMPVEVVQQFEHWRRVRDWEGTQGWVHERMLGGKRGIIVKGGIKTLYTRPDARSGAVARAEPGVVARLIECQGPWCRVDAVDATGWVLRSDIWGVYPDETVP